MTTAARATARKRSKEEVEYAKAVVTGLYAAVGLRILSARNHKYSLALKNIRRVAFEQAAEMVRGES